MEGGGGLSNCLRVFFLICSAAESVCVVEVDLFDLTLRVCSVSPEMNSHKVG